MKKTVYIKYQPNSWDEKKITEVCSAYGKVESVFKFPEAKIEGKEAKNAYLVTMENGDDIKKLVEELHEKEFEGQKIFA